MKKLKLRKEVKFITASIALGLTLCAVPTMKVIAEDDSVDTPDLYTRLMAAETMDEFETLANDATDEDFALLTEDQLDIIGEYANSLIVNEYSENDIDNKTDDVTLNDDPVQSEIIYPTVNFTNVAPLVDNSELE